MLFVSYKLVWRSVSLHINQTFLMTAWKHFFAHKQISSKSETAVTSSHLPL